MRDKSTVPPWGDDKFGAGSVLGSGDTWVDGKGLRRVVGGPFDNRVMWETKDQRGYFIENMETTHIRNCIANILIRNNWRGAYMPLLTAELERRNNLEGDHDHDIRSSDGGAGAS